MLFIVGGRVVHHDVRAQAVLPDLLFASLFECDMLWYLCIYVLTMHYHYYHHYYHYYHYDHYDYYVLLLLV